MKGIQILLTATFLIIVAGFSRTYFFSASSSSFPWPIHLHAICMSSWCILAIAQAYLARKKKMKLHRALGKASPLLVGAIIFSTHAIVRLLMSRHTGKPTFDGILSAQIVSVTDMLVFLVFYIQAMVFRRRKDFHIRYVMCSVLCLTPPATTRLLAQMVSNVTWFNPFYAALAFLDLTLIALIVADVRVHKRTIAPYPVALGIVLVVQVLRPLVQNSSWWKSTALYFLS